MLFLFSVGEQICKPTAEPAREPTHYIFPMIGYAGRGEKQKTSWRKSRMSEMPIVSTETILDADSRKTEPSAI